MRQTLVDHARRRNSLKRGGLFERVPWDDALRRLPAQRKEVLEVDSVIRRLSKDYPRQARIIELRYFAGLSIQETAEMLNVSPATVRADWTRAKTRLKEQFSNL
jgi:RNA polymerase sigma factor (TIGR02999 family)